MNEGKYSLNFVCQIINSLKFCAKSSVSWFANVWCSQNDGNNGGWTTGIRLRTPLKFWSATMFEAAAWNFGPPHNFEPPTVIANGVPWATRVFSLVSVGCVTGHMVPIAWCWLPYWKIGTVNNLATVIFRSAQISLFSKFDNIFFGLTC